MIKSKAIQVLRTFSANELRLFVKFVNSPLHNSNKNLLRLFLYLKKYHPDYDEKRFTKEDLFENLFPGKTYKDEKIRELFSDLLKKELEFLRIFSFSRNPHQADIFLLNELNIRKLDSLFNSSVKSLYMETLDKSKLDEDVYKFLMDIYEQKISFNVMRGNIDNVYNDVIENREFLVSYFLIRLFKSTQDLKQIERTGIRERFMNLADEMINSLDFGRLFKYLDKSDDKSYRVLEMYYNMMMVYLKNDDSYYYKFKELITGNFKNLTASESYDLLVSLNNCCQYLINSGRQELLKEFLDSYKFMLSNGIYKTEDSPYMSAFDFRNIVGVGAQQEEFEWTENFIEEYKEKLEPEQKDNLVNYSAALLFYYRHDFDSSLNHLSMVKNMNIVLKIDIRTLLMRIYFDLNAYEEFLSLAESFRQLIKKSGVLDKTRKLYILNFIKYSSDLFKIKNDKKQEDLAFLKKSILSNEQVSIKFWLLDKIKELENN